MPRRLAFLLACTLLPAALPAMPSPLPAGASAEPAGNVPPSATPPTLFSRISGLFDIELPRLDPPGTFRLTFNPRFGDLIKRDYMRVMGGVRWAVDDHLGFSVEAESYATHGLGGGTSTYGIGELHFGTKYLLPAWPGERYETSLGLNIDVPTGSPPLDLTDGNNHFIPSLTVQRRCERWPRLTLFTGLSADVLVDSSVETIRGDPGNTPTEDTWSVTTGGIYDMGQLKWTLQAIYTTTTFIDSNQQHYFTVRPSVLWFVPKRYLFNTKTQWIVGFGARSTWGPAGYEFSTSNRVRAEITFRQVVNRIRDRLDRPKSAESAK